MKNDPTESAEERRPFTATVLHLAATYITVENLARQGVIQLPDLLFQPYPHPFPELFNNLPLQLDQQRNVVE
jgi:hypothetical protein